MICTCTGLGPDQTDFQKAEFKCTFARQARSLSLRGIPWKIREFKFSVMHKHSLIVLQTRYVTSLLRIAGAFFLSACKRCSDTSVETAEQVFCNRITCTVVCKYVRVW